MSVELSGYPSSIYPDAHASSGTHSVGSFLDHLTMYGPIYGDSEFDIYALGCVWVNFPSEYS